MKSYLFIDTETTGFSHRENEILEIGLLFVSDKRLEAYSQINRIKGIIPPHITKITGITNAMMMNEGIDPKINMAYVYDNYIRHADIIIGHNIIDFDAGFIDSDLKKLGLKLNKNLLHDTMKREIAAVNNKGYSLEDTAKKYKVVLPKHRAKFDAITTLGVYNKQNIVVPDVLREFYKTCLETYYN